MSSGKDPVGSFVYTALADEVWEWHEGEWHIIKWRGPGDAPSGPQDFFISFKHHEGLSPDIDARLPE